MVRLCAFPDCGNKMKRHASRSFHRLPFGDRDTLRRWLAALHMDADTPISSLRLADHRVCSDHFTRDDYCQSNRRRNPAPKHLFLRKDAVPRAEAAAAADTAQPQDNAGVTGAVPDRRGSTAPQHLVDEEAIMQLMRICPKCNRKCRCTKFSRSPYLIAYQKCYFCDFQRKWASQPEAVDVKIYNVNIPPKRKVKSKAAACGGAEPKS